MGTVHRLIIAEGKQAALQEGLFERTEVEAASSYLSDEDPAIGFLYSGFCQAALPHKRLPDAEGWHVQSDRVSLIVEPGMRLGRAGTLEPVGVPYGSRARLILIYCRAKPFAHNRGTSPSGAACAAGLGVWVFLSGGPAFPLSEIKLSGFHAAT